MPERKLEPRTPGSARILPAFPRTLLTTRTRDQQAGCLRSQDSDRGCYGEMTTLVS